MIKEYQNRNGKLKLVKLSYVAKSKNVFSVLVGKNGTGKSTFLGNLTVDIIRDYQNLQSEILFNNLSRTKNFPSQVIAVSTSPFDKFPLNRFGRVSEYTYLGLRDLFSSNIGLSYLSKIIASLIESVSLDNSQASEIGAVLDYLGYFDKLHIKFRQFTSEKFRKKILDMENPIEILNYSNHNPIRHFNRRFFINKDSTVNERKIKKLKKIIIDFENEQYFQERFYKINFDKNGLDLNYKHSDEILFLINAGIIRLENVEIRSKEDGHLFSIKDASSGEQSILLSILGIASKISDNSLICIDEPEVCLHPQWQEKYIELLVNTFDRYKRCHFIIATHSPQIISNLPYKNSFIINMSNNSILESSTIVNKSSDFQLARIFNYPGNKNEYLARIALNIFTKVSKRKMFDDDDLINFEILYEVKDLIDPLDPVFDLIMALIEMKKNYG